ncbi:hypothetical protein ACHAWT_000327 [Skeletonema menzelii]
MMMEQPVTKPVAQEKKPAPPSNASAEERVNDLERRLNNLGGGEKKATATTASASASSASVSTQGKNNPLLARIMAAQERARQAEQKEKEAKAAAQAEVQQKRREDVDAAEKQRREEEERIQKSQAALRMAAGHALEDKQNEILRELEGKPMVVPKEPTNQAAATKTAGVAMQQQMTPPQTVQPAVPIMKSLDPPPPFESMKFPPPKILKQDEDEMVGHGMNSRVLREQPPSFDMVQRQKVDAPPPAPSAPDLSHLAPPDHHHHLEGVLPVAPPFAQALTHAEMPPPPSFDTVEQQMQQQEQQQSGNFKTPEEDIIDFDIDGNPLTPEQREAMIEEQRKLYENIMKEKAENDAAIARATADAFDSRSANAAVKAMDPHSAHTHSMDSMGRNITGEEEDANDEEAAAERREPRRMVKIGNNQTVALHGQGRTKKAIKDGTAILVQCINCQNWMQVTGTATLMFCPVCQVVSPVIKQSEVLTKEEAVQLTMDRKLAEKLQAEAYDHDDSNEKKEEHKDEGYFSKLFGSSSSNAAAVRSSSVTSTDSWWDKISNIVSYGVSEEPRERGELGVTLPPGSSSVSTYPGERRGTLSPAITDGGRDRHGEETQGLLRPVIDGNGNEANLPAARVAEQKPLFSCVADSVSSAASALFSTAEGEEDEEGNIYGVDASSLLVTSAGRQHGGDYSRVPENE